jgi:hypothetical protein
MFAPISSSTNTSRSRAISPATVTLQATLWNSSRSTAPTVVFLREAKPLQQALYRRNAQRSARHCLQKLAPVAYGSRGAFSYILF